MIHFPQSIESKFRFVTMAAQRCEQLIRGARPRVETVAEKPTTIALQEVLAGLVDERGAEAPVESPEAGLDLAGPELAKGEEMPTEAMVLSGVAPEAAPPAE